MITVFSEHITNRLTYVLDFCFEQKGLPYKIITSSEDWNNSRQKDINYSNLDLSCRQQIIPQGILFESEIYQSKKITRSGDNIEIDAVYDEFGLIFYLLSRYESYFSLKQDSHGRLPGKENSLVKLGMNKVAVVDRIVKRLWENLELDYDGVKESYKFLPTFDIDVAWAYKNRKFVRSVGAFIKGKRPLERLGVLLGLQKDPYDTYGDIANVETKTGRVICFTLLGDWGKYDKNIHWENLSYGSLIRGLNLEGDIGIHPSYASHLSQEKIDGEIKRLESITGHNINLSRQHFLRFKIPETYNLLIQAGISDDYSMGFADNVGFRAGTCFPFNFFDLQTNQKTDLKIHPFAYMDSALKDYLKLSPQEGKNVINELIAEVRSVGGQFVMIWHNSSINDRGEWKGWKDVLNYTIKEGLTD